MARQKISWLLILQGWAMLWVVIGHSPLNMENMPTMVELLYKFAYSFHMPLFILVSGWLFQFTRLNGNRLLKGYWSWEDYKTIMHDKLLRLGIPFIAFTILAMAMKVVFADDMSRQTNCSIRGLLMAIINPFDGPNNEMWFIGTLLWFFALAPLWKWSCSGWQYELLLSIVLLLLNLFHPSSNIFCLRQVCTQGFYFYSGILICKYGIEEIAMKHRWLILIIGLISFILFRPIHFKLGSTCGAIMFSFGISFLFDEYFPKAFFSFRNYTYQIFLMGIFAQIAIKILYSKVDMPYVLGYILCVLVGVYVPVIVSKVIEKINWTPLLLCVGLKKK